MGKILKSADYFSSGQLPVRVYYTDHSHDLGFHSHEFSEIAILFEGTAIYETEYGEDVISPGDVLMIPPGGSHRYREEKGVRLMNILFDFRQLNIPVQHICRHPGYVALFGIKPEYYRRCRFYPKFKLRKDRLAFLERILVEANSWQKSGLPGAPLAVYGAFLQSIPVLLESFAPDCEGSMPVPLPEKFQQTLQYMLNNFSAPQNISLLAKRAGMSQSTFTRTFKKAFGQTPLQYLLILRLKAAQEFLRDGLTISEAAAKCGFDDCNYFSRLYRKHLNERPGQWKKRRN